MAVFTNYATLTYTGGSANSNTVVGELRDTLTAVKTAVSPSYSAGGTVTYALSLVNSGCAPITVPSVADDLGAYRPGCAAVYPLTYREGSLRYFVNGILQTPPPVDQGPPLVITGITVPAEGSVVLIYEASVNENAPLGTGCAIDNTAAVYAEGLSAPLTASACIPTEDAPRLSISKALCPAVVTEHGQLTYTFVIENTGNTAADAGDNIVLSDTFDPILTNISVTFNGTAWISTNYTYNVSTGEFATVPGRITVPAASYAQNSSGCWSVTPGTATITVTGTIG